MEFCVPLIVVGDEKMVNHKQIAEMFAKRCKKSPKGDGRMFVENGVLYSYGYHFPLACWANDNLVLLNTSRYSVSTSKHRRIVRDALRVRVYVSLSPHIINVSTEEIKEAVRLLGHDQQFNIFVKTELIHPENNLLLRDVLETYMQKQGITNRRASRCARDVVQKIDAMAMLSGV